MQLYQIKQHRYFPRLYGFNFYILNKPKRLVLNHINAHVLVHREHMDVWGDIDETP